MMCPTPVQPRAQPLSLVLSNPLSNPRPTLSLSTPHTPIGLVRPFGRAHTQPSVAFHGYLQTAAI